MQSNIKVKKTPIDARVMETSKTIQIKPKPIQSAPKAGNTTIKVDGVSSNTIETINTTRKSAKVIKKAK